MNYTPDQLRRRNESLWTPVQAVTAPVQFLTFIVSLILVIQYFATGQGYMAAHIASSIKVVMMVFITITGMAWEFDVYGKYFLAKEFFWEDMINAVSLVLHLAFIAAWLFGASERLQMTVMLVALISYVVNFIQFGRRGLMAAKQRKAARVLDTQS